MKRLLLTATILIVFSAAATAQSPAADEMLERVHLDAQVIKRVAEVARRDLPNDLLQRIIEEDIELLRGRQSDGSYQYAHFEPIESGRVSEGFTVKPREEGENLDRNQFRAKNVYKLIVHIPSRRLLVARNRDIYLDRIEVSYEDQEGRSLSETFNVNQRLEAGEEMEFELPRVATDAIATVYARSDTKSANMELIFVKAELVDNADSPYFGVIQSAKLLQEAISRRDQTAMQSLASSMADRIDPTIDHGSTLPPIISRVERADVPERAFPVDSIPGLEIYLRLERIEDLLDGTPEERDDARERLREVIRELRSTALDAAQRR